MKMQDRFSKYAILLTLSSLLAAVCAEAQSASHPANKKAGKAPIRAVAESVVPSLEPKAVEILKATSERLKAAHTVAFTAVETFESADRFGHPIIFATKSEVTLQRPDKLRVVMSADGPASEFYYDGKVMMAYAPVENLLAIADAPPTIDSALEAAYHAAAIYFPFTDLIVADPYNDLAPGLKLAYYIGQSQVVGGTTTDMVAYSGDGVFAQIWIGAEDKLPRVVHVVYLDDPAQLRHNLLLSNWQLDAAVTAESFAPANTENAKRIPFAHPRPEPAAGATPPLKGQGKPSR